MKRVLLSTMLLLTLTTGVCAAAGQSAVNQEELVDSTGGNGVDVFSDTTTVDTLVADPTSSVTTTTYGRSRMDQFFAKIDGDDLTGMLFVLAVLLILFVLSPVLIIIALFYFIHKNRKEKMRLAEMAMQQGQPIPDRLLEERPEDQDVEYQRGMRQCFIGVGLMIFLGFAAGNVGFGVGALVFCIGLGKVFTSKTGKQKKDY